MAFSFLHNRGHTNHDAIGMHIAITGGSFKRPRVNTAVNQADSFALYPCFNQQLRYFP
jgi:hypothetical protein